MGNQAKHLDSMSNETVEINTVNIVTMQSDSILLQSQASIMGRGA